MTQDEALSLLKMGHNVFLTGPAGSGKTYVLNAYIKWLGEKNIPAALTASTGIASTHIGGVTVHSWTGLGIKDRLSPYDIEAMLEKKYLHDRFNGTAVLIIDEISMLSARQLDAIDLIAKAFKGNDLPFGGLQVVLAGDFFQLPPVGTRGESVHLAYEALSWKNGRIKPCYLESQFRHTDPDFNALLMALREQGITPAHRDILKSRLGITPDVGVPPTRLFTHNEDADAVNIRELSALSGTMKVYEMRTKGKSALADALKRSVLAPERLALKPGARVMFVRNNFEAGFVNGTLGVVEYFARLGEPVIRIASGEKITVVPEVWRVEEDGKTKAEISQLPLRLSWAITVHKSQGMSLDALEVDLSKAFLPGMGYVALSRVRTLKGLGLLGLNELALLVDEKAAAADEIFCDMSEKFARGLSLLPEAEKKKLIDQFVAESARALPEKKVSTFQATKILIEEGLTLADIGKRRKLTEETIISHLEKLTEEEPGIDISHLKPAASRLEKIRAAFKESGNLKLSAAKSLLPASYSFKEIRLGRLFLDEI